jgi:SMC interacting uncharacterized protein involved in chromosome segregation
MNDDLENLQHQINNLADRLDNLVSRLSNTEHELTLKIDDARNDAERATDSLRTELQSLEHKVDY